MSEQLDATSLTKLASKKGPVSRETPDARAKASSSRTSGQGGFDGFLKTFLGKDKSSSQTSLSAATERDRGFSAKSKAGGKTSLAGSLDKSKAKGGKSSTEKAAKAASNMSAEEKRALRRAMEKTVGAEDAAVNAELPKEAFPLDALPLLDPLYNPDFAMELPFALPEGELSSSVPELEIDPAVAAAAEEAAKLIWSLLAGGDENTSGPDAVLSEAGESLGDAFASLAEMLDAMKHASGSGGGDSLAGMGAGAGSIDAEAVAQAMETANASAEMNRAAVLSALEDLLDGMPRQALEEALEKTAREMGLEGSGGDELFNAIAKALDVEIIAAPLPVGSTANHQQILAELAKASAASGQELDIPQELQKTSGSVFDGDDRLIDVYAGTEANLDEPATETGISQAENETETASPTETPAAEQDAVSDLYQAKQVKDTVGAASIPETAEAGQNAVTKTGDSAEENSQLENALPIQAHERQKEVLGTEKNSDPQTVETRIFGLLKQFLKEKVAENAAEGPINLTDPITQETAGGLLDEFAEWVAGADNSPQMQELVADRTRLVQVLNTAIAVVDSGDGLPAEDEFSELFSWVRKNLESLLQTGPSMKAAKSPEAAKINADTSADLGAKTQSQPQSASAAGEAFRESSGQNAYAAPAGTATATAATTATPQPSSQGGASAMLDQIQNIERLAEAMRMGNRNGVKNLTLQLAPAELGKVLLRVEARDGVVSAYLRVEKPEAAEQLTNNLSQLRENLKAQGIELGELDIRQQSQNQALMDFGGNRHRRNAETDADAHGSYRGTGSEEGEDEATEGIKTGGGGNRDANGNLNFFA